MTTTGVIVQARMTSSRFPGKSMKLLDGKPVLQHVLERAKSIKGVDFVILAMPGANESMPMADLAKTLGVAQFFGDEHDVLERYWQAADAFNLDVIVRITGDCPLINPVVSADVIKLRAEYGVDYASNCYPERTFPKGFDTECFALDALDFAYAFATEAYDREHVTSFLQRDEEISRALLRQQVDESEINYCVDLPGDIERLEKLIRAWKQANLREFDVVARH